jgi:hypothetical protein
MKTFTRADYDRLHALVFRSDYPGYKPAVQEAPNSDGKFDTKRYAHIAPKYLSPLGADADSFLWAAYNMAFAEACHVAQAFGMAPDDPFFPDSRFGALRILDYGPGDFSGLHTDFDLFTTMFYRDQPAQFVAHGHALSEEVRKINAQCHVGRIGELVGLGTATPHEVLPVTEGRQRSIVYFAIPNHDSILPSGEMVRDWLNKIMASSRTEFKPYQKAS